VKPEGQLEQRLHDALRRPEGSTWPDERGAFDRFRRWRFRRGLAMAARASLALTVALAVRPPVVATVLGRDKPAHWAGFVSPPLPRGTRVTRVVALDAGRRTVAEAHGYPLSHPACHLFR
jgi:hypothetical protein